MCIILCSFKLSVKLDILSIISNFMLFSMQTFSPLSLSRNTHMITQHVHSMIAQATSASQ